MTKREFQDAAHKQRCLAHLKEILAAPNSITGVGRAVLEDALEADDLDEFLADFFAGGGWDVAGAVCRDSDARAFGEEHYTEIFSMEPSDYIIEEFARHAYTRIGDKVLLKAIKDTA